MNQSNILTERLILRSFMLGDARYVQRLAGNRDVARMTLNIPHPIRERHGGGLNEFSYGKTESGVQLSYAIESLQLGVLMGAISLTHMEATQANLGYWVGE